ncbi:MAG: SDR family oxidoreductase [Thermoplasmatales archaeon]
MLTGNLLANKDVLITGGGTGLGRAMGEKFGRLGARIAICGRRENVLRETCDYFSKLNIQCNYHTCDIRYPEQVKETVDFFIDAFGKLDILVNNAAGNFVSPTEKLSPHAVDSVINIVLHGTFYMTLEVGKRWITDGKNGVMLYIVTPYAWTGSPFVVPSAAAKAGVLAIVRSLAVEWGRYGIRQVAIAPGIFPTEGSRKNLYPLGNLEDRLKDRVPLGRLGNLEELSDLAAYLVSDLASFINGEVVTIDGGEWLKGAGEFSDYLGISNDVWEKIREISKSRK